MVECSWGVQGGIGQRGGVKGLVEVVDVNFFDLGDAGAVVAERERGHLFQRGHCRWGRHAAWYSGLFLLAHRLLIASDELNLYSFTKKAV